MGGSFFTFTIDRRQADVTIRQCHGCAPRVCTPTIDDRRSTHGDFFAWVRQIVLSSLHYRFTLSLSLYSRLRQCGLGAEKPLILRTSHRVEVLSLAFRIVRATRVSANAGQPGRGPEEAHVPSTLWDLGLLGVSLPPSKSDHRLPFPSTVHRPAMC